MMLPIFPVSHSCIVTPDLAGPSRNGGIGTHCLHLARFLSERGDQVTIVHTGHLDDPDLESWRSYYEKESGARLLLVSELPDDPSVHVAPHSARHVISHRVYRWLKSKDFSAVHFQDWQGNGAVTARAKHTGCAFQHTLITVTAHGSSEWIREGMGQFPTGGNESLIDDTLERTSVELADVLVCPSQYMQAWLVEHGWRLPERIEIAPYVVNTANPDAGNGSLLGGFVMQQIDSI